MATAIGHTIGALRVVIGADTTALKRGIGEAGSSLGRLRSFAMPAVAAIAAVGAAATAAAAGLVSMARSEMELIDTQGKLARSLGGTVTGLRALQVAAEDAGIDGLDASLNRLNRRLGAVEMGGGPAVETVKRLGLNLAELAEMDVDDRLATIADRIRDYGGSAQESARHLQQLGFEQKGALELFAQGGDAIRAARDQVVAFGMAVSDVDLARIEAANNTFDRLSRIMSGIRTQLAIEVAPVLQALATQFLEVAHQAGGLGPAIRGGVDVAVETLGFVMDAVNGVARSFELAGKAAAIAFASMRVAANSTAGAIVAGPHWAIGRLIDALNLLPGVDIESPLQQFVSHLEADTAEAMEIVRQGVADIEETLMRPMPSGRFKELVEQARAAAEAAASAGRAGPTGGGGAPGAPDPDAAKAAAERRKQLADELAAIRTHLADRATLEHRAAMDRLERLHAITKEGLIVEREQRELAIGISDQFYRTMRGLRDQDFADRQRALLEQHELELISFDEYFRARLEAAREHEQSITQMAIDAFNFRRNELQALRDDGDLTEEEYRARIEEIERAHQEELTRIAAEGAAARRQVSADEAQQRQAITQGMLANLTQLMNSGNKEMFRIGKIAAVAQALLKGREAVVSSYAAGARIGGPPLGAAFAATAAAATAAQISAVASTSFGGGGGVTAGSGGVAPRPTDTLPDDPVDPGKTERQAVTITLQGELFNRQQVRDLIEQINEATADGAVLRLS